MNLHAGEGRHLCLPRVLSLLRGSLCSWGRACGPGRFSAIGLSNTSCSKVLKQPSTFFLRFYRFTFTIKPSIYVGFILR